MRDQTLYKEPTRKHSHFEQEFDFFLEDEGEFNNQFSHNKQIHGHGCHCLRCQETGEIENFLGDLSNSAIDLWYGIEDFTKKAKLKECSRQRGYNCRSGTRQLSQIDSIILHQTGGSRSTDTNRYLKIPIHYVVLFDGTIMKLYPETDYINHANSFNSWSVGIEFAGTFVNDRGKCWWNRKKKYVAKGYSQGKRVCGLPSAAQISAGRNLVKAISMKVPSIRYILAHRQAKSSRNNDPGPYIWLQIGEWAKKNLNFIDADNYTESSGNPIPDAWRKGTLI